MQAIGGFSSAQGAESAAPAAQPAFDIDAYDVDGATLLDRLSIERAVYPYLGPGRTREDVNGARRALEAAYHDRGYDSVVVEIPSQNVSDRLVRLHVVESSVGRLRVTGTRYYSPGDIRKAAGAIAEGEVPNFQQAQAEISELNRLPGRQITPVVLPGKVPGTVDIDLKVADQNPAHASVELTNDHSPNTDDLRLTANVHYDNLWQLGHSLSATYAVASRDRSQSEVFAGSYLAPIPDSRWSLLAYGYTSNSNVATIGSITVLGKGYTAGLRGIAQLPPIQGFSQSLSLGGDFKHTDQLLSPFGGSTLPTQASIDYVPLTAVYTLQSDTPSMSAHASLGVTAGIRVANGAQAQFQNNAYLADANFVHVNLDGEYTARLPFGAAADFHFVAQFADTSLVPSEQFAAGGLQSVRGYLQAVALGDDGVVGQAELRSPLIQVTPRWLLDDWRVFAFYDAGKAWLLNPLPGQTSQTSIYSTGVGTRFQLFSHLNGDLVVAFPLRATTTSAAGQAYTQFSVKAGF